jgi:dTDP-glucose pyrophosphorylase
MAAGVGSRYGGLKQIDPVGPGGEIILDYSVHDALEAGFGRVVFVIKKEIEDAFRERVGESIEKQCETAYVYQRLDDLPDGFEVPPQRSKPWGTAHAVLSCRDTVEPPFAVINADDFYGRSAFRALGDYLASARDRDGVYDYCMVGYVLGNTLTEHGHVARGVCTVDAEGFLVGIREHTRIERHDGGARTSEDGGETWAAIAADSVVSMNLWGFTPGVFGELAARFPHFLHERRGDILKAEYFLPDVIGQLIGEGKARVRVLPTDERWFGVTYREDRPRVKQAVQDMVRRGVYPERLWEQGPKGAHPQQRKVQPRKEINHRDTKDTE